MVNSVERQRQAVRVFLAALVVFVGAPLASTCTEDTQAFGDRIAQLLGRYEVIEAKRFRGGLTTEVEAEALVGTIQAIQTDAYSINLPNRVYKSTNPQYSIQTFGPYPEGVIPERKFGPFFGVAIDRDVVVILLVEDASIRDPNPPIEFEIVDTQLWFLHDGFVYKMRKCDD